MERPHVRNGRSIANLNTLTSILINANARKRVRARNRELLPFRRSAA